MDRILFLSFTHFPITAMKDTQVLMASSGAKPARLLMQPSLPPTNPAQNALAGFGYSVRTPESHIDADMGSSIIIIMRRHSERSEGLQVPLRLAKLLHELVIGPLMICVNLANSIVELPIVRRLCSIWLADCARRGVGRI